MTPSPNSGKGGFQACGAKPEPSVFRTIAEVQGRHKTRNIERWQIQRSSHLHRPASQCRYPCVLAFWCLSNFRSMMSHIQSLRPRLVCAAIFAVALLSSAKLAPARSDEPHWIRITSSHFTIVTDADLQKGSTAVVRFEQMRTAFAQLLLRTRVNISQPIDILAVRSDDEFDKLAPLRQGQTSAGPGFVIPGDDRIYFVLNLAQADSWRATTHELARLLLTYNYPPTQPWFDEGFVEYFSSVRLDNKGTQIGADPESFIGLLNTAQWLTMPALFGTRDVPPNPQGSHHDLFHAQSWIVMHYLLSQNKLPETGTYFDLVQNQKLPIEDAIRKAYGISAEQFEKAVKDYFHALAEPPPIQEKDNRKQLPAPPGTQVLDTTTADQIGSSAQDVSPSEAQALLAEMCVRLPERRAPAVAQLEALASGPKSDTVVVHRALGWVDLDKKDFNSSAEELSKGADLSPKDPWLHFYLALLKRRVADSSAAGVQGLPNMIQDLHIMLDWAPDFAEARAMLAMAQLEGGGVNAALDSMRIALQYAPRSQVYLLEMAQIYMAGKYWDAATAMLNRLKNGLRQAEKLRSLRTNSSKKDCLRAEEAYGVPPQRTPDAGSPQPPASATPSSAAASSSPLPSSSPGATQATRVANAG